MDAKDNPLEKVLKDVIAKMTSRRPGEEEIGEAWARAAGNGAARHSRPVSFKTAVLVVNVDGSSWLYELSTAKREILRKLEADLKGKKRVIDIRFRIGAVGDPKPKE